ncbi:DUF350 domain-containing protein [Coraliomargarita parva]|uniref:DUF350 domain-containing protein n=1 Tax=Coraliomargarita parva TaxID=3014050 RepID=UPI0022B333E4|nr:DUF350 domain-containing protein [Coraliomargarita parva]
MFYQPVFAASEWLDVSVARQVLDSQAVVYVAIALTVLIIAKIINSMLSAYQLDEELTAKDNKAIGVSFSAFLLSVAIIVWGVLVSPSSTVNGVNLSDHFWADLASTFIWSVIGVGLLLVARVINDKLLLPKFEVRKELVSDRNVGTGAVLAGSYLAAAFVVQVSVMGEGQGNFLTDLGLTLAYFFVGQLCLVVFGFVYQAVTPYDLHQEIEKDNVAAGISFGGALTACGILTAGYLSYSPSLPGLVVWFIISTFLLLACRYVIDKVVLPKSAVDEEIQRDQNWGVALIETACMVGVSFIIIASFG